MSANSVTKNFNNHIFDKVNNPPGKCYILKLALSEATQKFCSEKVGKSVNLLRRKNPPKRDWTNFRCEFLGNDGQGGQVPRWWGLRCSLLIGLWSVNIKIIFSLFSDNAILQNTNISINRNNKFSIVPDWCGKKNCTKTTL